MYRLTHRKQQKRDITQHRIYA